MLWNYQKSLGD